MFTLSTMPAVYTVALGLTTVIITVIVPSILAFVVISNIIDSYKSFKKLNKKED